MPAPVTQPAPEAEAPAKRALLSIVLPSYREAENLPVLYQRLQSALAEADFDWEAIVIDDHSPDRTFDVAAAIAASDKRFNVVRLARNAGGHLASLAGVELARGDAVVVMAADLQDPPELLHTLMARWRDGDQVVWACRRRREGASWWTKLMSRGYYALLRRLVPNETLPPQGADFFLLDRKVADALNQCRESNFSILALILWLGFRQGQISYDKQARLHGRSSWNFSKNIRLVMDSVISFSHLPLRLISIFGLVVAFVGFLYAADVALNYFIGRAPVEGWSSLMVVTLLLSGTQMIMLGVIGEYVWRTLHETRGRPRYSIERAVSNGVRPLSTSYATAHR